MTKEQLIKKAEKINNSLINLQTLASNLVLAIDQSEYAEELEELSIALDNLACFDLEDFLPNE